MNEPHVKRRIGQIVSRMQDLITNDVALGELRGLANELDGPRSELSDSRLRDAISAAVKFVVGGLVGSTQQRHPIFLE